MLLWTLPPMRSSYAESVLIDHTGDIYCALPVPLVVTSAAGADLCSATLSCCDCAPATATEAA